MTYQYHDESIVKNLDEHTVFVFGSNMAGQHADGAARTALEHFGAIKGVGRGWSGQSYAIPTMNEHIQQMPLSQIQHYIDDFKIYTKNHPKISSISKTRSRPLLSVGYMRVLRIILAKLFSLSVKAKC